MEPTVPGRNGGRLLAGGKPGNRGGTGVMPSKVRALCREKFSAAIDQIGDIALGKDPDASAAEKTRAFDALGKYGMGELKTVQIENDLVGQLAVDLAKRIFEPTDEKLREFADALATECFNAVSEDSIETDDGSDD